MWVWTVKSIFFEQAFIYTMLNNPQYKDAAIVIIYLLSKPSGSVQLFICIPLRSNPHLPQNRTLWTHAQYQYFAQLLILENVDSSNIKKVYVKQLKACHIFQWNKIEGCWYDWSTTCVVQDESSIRFVCIFWAFVLAKGFFCLLAFLH